MVDKILYTLVTHSGGMDGRDHNDKGGTIVFATFDREKADKHKSKPYCRLEKEVIDYIERRRQALAKLDQVDRLVLDLGK